MDDAIYWRRGSNAILKIRRGNSKRKHANSKFLLIVQLLQHWFIKLLCWPWERLHTSWTSRRDWASIIASNIWEVAILLWKFLNTISPRVSWIIPLLRAAFRSTSWVSPPWWSRTGCPSSGGSEAISARRNLLFSFCHRAACLDPLSFECHRRGFWQELLSQVRPDVKKYIKGCRWNKGKWCQNLNTYVWYTYEEVCMDVGTVALEIGVWLHFYLDH